LVCPGCGAYAPDIAPPGSLGHTGPRPEPTAATAGWESVTPAPWPDRPTPAAARLRPAHDASTPQAGPSADVRDAPPARQGRAARRRQLARWKKNQRRAVVATAVALVGGGLTVASMDRHSADRAQAAAAPDDRSMGAAPRQAPEHPSAAPTASAHAAPHATPAPRTPGAQTPAQQYGVVRPRSTPSLARTDAAAPPAPLATSAPLPRTTPASSSGHASSVHTAAPAPQASTAAPTGAAQPSARPSAAPAPASTSPTQLCVLVLCLG
jgi:hypothetical protein